MYNCSLFLVLSFSGTTHLINIIDNTDWQSTTDFHLLIVLGKEGKNRAE